MREDECDADVIRVTSSFTLSSQQMTGVCPSKRSFVLEGGDQQHFNVTVWNFNKDNRPSLTITDVISGNQASVGSDVRVSHLMTSLGNRLRVSIGNDVTDSFMLDVEGKLCEKLSIKSFFSLLQLHSGVF